MDIAVLKLEGGKANALTPQLLDHIERTIDAFEQGSARAAVLTGYERSFSAGLALTHIIDFERDAMRAFILHFSRVMTRVFSCEKPIVAAINGHAIAGGCVLALMCDVRLASDNPAVRIGLNESQIGIGVPLIVVEGLRAAVPSSSFVPIAFEGTLFDPARALALGLVSELASPDDLLDRASARASALAAPGSAAVAQIKRVLRAPSLDNLARNGDREIERWLDTWFSAEAQERLRATVARLGSRNDAGKGAR
jgi:enoyl-CoA hydratase